MEAAEWSTREGEDVFYIGLIGAGGFGEIHEVTLRFSLLANPFSRSTTGNALRFETHFMLLLTSGSVLRES
jgi:hypothetical protein